VIITAVYSSQNSGNTRYTVSLGYWYCNLILFLNLL